MNIFIITCIAQEINEFLEKCDLPKLDHVAAEEFDAEITQDEVKAVIDQFPEDAVIISLDPEKGF